MFKFLHMDDIKKEKDVFCIGSLNKGVYDLPMKLLGIVNLYLSWDEPKRVIQQNNFGLLVYYIVHGYSEKTKKKYAEENGKTIEYVRVVDTHLKKKGHLIDASNDRRKRDIGFEAKGIRLFIKKTESDPERLALFTFYSKESDDKV